MGLHCRGRPATESPALGYLRADRLDDFFDDDFFDDDFFDDDFFDDAFFDEDFFDAFFLAGTLPPARRASESPIAIACLRLLTFFPERPERRLPSFISLMLPSTLLAAFLP
jgi:hypothetical protein